MLQIYQIYLDATRNKALFSSPEAEALHVEEETEAVERYQRDTRHINLRKMKRASSQINNLLELCSSEINIKRNNIETQ